MVCSLPKPREALFSINDYTLVNLSSGFHRDRTGIPGKLKRSDLEAGVHRSGTMTPDDYNEVDDYYFYGGPEVHVWQDSILSLNASYRKRKSNSHFSIAGGFFEDNTETTTRTLSPQLVVKRDFGDNANTLTLGIDREKVVEHIENDSTFTGRNAYRLEKETSAFYLTDQVETDNNWHLSAGYRHDRTRYRFNPGAIDEDKDLYSVGATYQAGQNSSVYAGYSKSFRYQRWSPRRQGHSQCSAAPAVGGYQLAGRTRADREGQRELRRETPVYQ